MILRIKRSHLVLETPLAVVRLLRLDVSHQSANVRGTHRKQPVPTLPREIFHALLFHPRRRSRFDLRHNFRRLSRRSQTQCQMNVIGHTSGPKTFAIQFSCRARQIRVQRIGNLFRYQRSTIFRAEDDMHQVETQRLRHDADYMSGLQPSTHFAQRNLGLRPRLVCGRTFGPLRGRDRCRHLGHFSRTLGQSFCCCFYRCA
jgi:hypothetical protein